MPFAQAARTLTIGPGVAAYRFLLTGFFEQATIFIVRQHQLQGVSVRTTESYEQ